MPLWGRSNPALLLADMLSLLARASAQLSLYCSRAPTDGGLAADQKETEEWTYAKSTICSSQATLSRSLWNAFVRCDERLNLIYEPETQGVKTLCENSGRYTALVADVDEEPVGSLPTM